MTQTSNGKAFEYALAQSFSQITNAPIQQNSSFRIAQNCFNGLETPHQDILEKASNEAAMFLLAHDKKIRQANSILLQDDTVGIKGDVRDIIIEVPKSAIGISAKHNHTAVKHSRLSDTIDFGNEWAQYPCSETYFNRIKPIFAELRELRTQGAFFRDIRGKESRIYLPVLIAFEDELKRLCNTFREAFVENLFRYLLGRYDFYKIMLKIKPRDKSVLIQSVNIGGSLEYGAKWKIPDKIISIARQDNSSNTIEVIFSHGWSISFRLHNARSLVEPSLKFDIQFVGISSGVGQHVIRVV